MNVKAFFAASSSRRRSAWHDGAVLDAAIEIGIGAFLAGRERDDAGIEAALVARGIAPGLASRLVFFLPLAFGRLLLRDCALRESYVAGEEEHALADDAVWVAVERRARGASRDEVSALGTRSSEVSAVNQFLQTHPERADALGELAFSCPTLGQALPALEPGDGGAPSPALAFRQFLEGHGHEVREVDGALCAGALRFGAVVYPRESSWAQVQVDFTIEHPALAVPRLLESFAGFGETWSDALRQTIVKFERNTLHVLIAGLLDRSSCADQVEWEPLGGAGGFEICFGGMLQTFGTGKAPLLGPLIDELKAALAAAVHGLRVFLAYDGSALSVCEVLLDNEGWAEGARIAEARDWRTGEETWGVRWFALVVPAPAA